MSKAGLKPGTLSKTPTRSQRFDQLKHDLSHRTPHYMGIFIAYS